MFRPRLLATILTFSACSALSVVVGGCSFTGLATPSRTDAADRTAESAGPAAPSLPEGNPAPVASAPTMDPPARDLEPPPVPQGPLPPDLGCGLKSPMPGGFTAGYAADTGLDIAGIKMPVFAIADATVIYAEDGHSLWSSPRDTDLAVLLELDEPLPWRDREVTHVWYAHLSELAFEQAEGATKRRRVAAGERLGTSGVANGAWHLHLGLLLDGDTSQRWDTFLLEDDAREVLCGLRAKQRLPAMETKTAR